MKKSLFSEEIYLKPHAKVVTPNLVDYKNEIIWYTDENWKTVFVDFSEVLYRKIPNDWRPIESEAPDEDIPQVEIAIANTTHTDIIKQPAHYTKAVQPIDYIMPNKLDFCEGNVIKYVTRWRDKDWIQDLKKARQYIDFLIEYEETGKPV